MMRLKAERISRGWTHADLGRAARVGCPEISRIECRHLIPYGVQAQRLAAALGIRVDQLTEEVELVVATKPEVATM